MATPTPPPAHLTPQAQHDLTHLVAQLGAGGWWWGEGHGPGPDSTHPALLDPFLNDWRGRYQGRALGVARPASVEGVQAVVRLCARHGLSLVPQGGNTSLVGGSVPDRSGRQIVLNLQRLAQVRQRDAANLTLTLEAGCTLAQAQAEAEAMGLLFPLSLGSEGTCTVGGNLASNAGGTQVLRYGTARELCLGLEVVTADGSLWSGLSGLRKDNSGYDLRNLFIGSEGTLGVITAATLKLHPRPRSQATALVACGTLRQCVDLLTAARERLGAGLTAFEAMARWPLQLVQRHQGDAARVLSGLQGDAGELPPWVVLIEHGSPIGEEQAQDELGHWLHEATVAGHADGTVMAISLAQQASLWALRNAIPLAEKKEGLMVKHDIALPISALTDFALQCEYHIVQRWPGARVVCFGHLGDGNLHYNVHPPEGHREGAALQAFESAVNTVVFDRVMAVGGSLSAEHGIGLLRRDELARRRDPVAQALMHRIKQALDPQHLFNPDRVLLRP